AARYFRRAKDLGGELIVECRKELIPLVAAMRVADRLIAKGVVLPEAEWHCHLCSLPGLFTPDLAAIPAAPYLAAPPDRAASLAPVLGQAGTDMKVGIVWSGSRT